MHQAHNIAWDSLTAHLIFISENPAVTPRRTGFFPRGLPTQAKSLNHFARTIATTVREFSDTERAKYPPRYDAPLHGQLFSDTILSRYSDLRFPSVTAKNQLIENWIERAGSPPSYSSSQGDSVADVVKVLITENQMDQLLMLAQHPRVPLIELHWLSWGHSFGWNCLMDYALEAYIFFNVLLSKPELHADGRYKLMTDYRRVCRRSTFSSDYDAQTFPHREFFWGSMERAVGEEEFDTLGDSNKLHEYLKMCFGLLYRYDMLVRECGRTVDWEECVAYTVEYLWNTKVDRVQDEKGGTVTRFA
ncbi:hypothetical protein C8F04DRAFT_85967 [Mycena alexandri]|uniref:Uncharacterized protein n=1 Tax=Mycena alexandri TaxID=1745969 RepID=A0AAD6TC72_9AGAR|nr:hypothetical protein C8F04DRAFT_85967 [Mycena alexandri]